MSRGCPPALSACPPSLPPCLCCAWTRPPKPTPPPKRLRTLVPTRLLLSPPGLLLPRRGEGVEGHVHLEIKAVSAEPKKSLLRGSRPVAPVVVAVDAPAAKSVPLTTFDGAKATTQSWRAVNDPVMGGQSTATLKVYKERGFALFEGETKIVPSLKAPGFCNMQAEGASFADASGANALQLVIRSTIAYSGFKASFGPAPRAAGSFFASYKADFPPIKASNDWQTVTIPFSSFSSKWSSYTGEPTTKCADDKSVCPDASHLRHLNAMEICAEGVAGKFQLAVKSISAVTVRPPAARPVTLALAQPAVHSAANPTHYGDPKTGCMSDEESVQVQGVSGDFCSPPCTGALKTSCPKDIPKGVTAAPQCALQDSASGNKYCALICSPKTDAASLRAGDAQCGTTGSLCRRCVSGRTFLGKIFTRAPVYKEASLCTECRSCCSPRRVSLCVARQVQVRFAPVRTINSNERQAF